MAGPWLHRLPASAPPPCLSVSGVRRPAWLLLLAARLDLPFSVSCFFVTQSRRMAGLVAGRATATAPGPRARAPCYVLLGAASASERVSWHYLCSSMQHVRMCTSWLLDAPSMPPFLFISRPPPLALVLLMFKA